MVAVYNVHVYYNGKLIFNIIAVCCNVLQFFILSATTPNSPLNMIWSRRNRPPISREQEDPKIIDAKKEEIKKLQEFGVYDEVKDIGQSLISTRWVMTKKGEKYKGRLVAHGFEELSNYRCDSPTVTKRFVFTLAVSIRWKLESLDITSAFLQAYKIYRNVFIKPPAMFRTNGLVWKLKKPLYGLGDSARMWYFTLHRTLIETGCVNSMLDKSLFCYYVNNKHIGMVVTHVDDLLYAGNTRFKTDVI